MTGSVMKGRRREDQGAAAAQYDCVAERCDWYGCYLEYRNPELDEAAQQAMGCWPTAAWPPEEAPLAPATPEEGQER